MKKVVLQGEVVVYFAKGYGGLSFLHGLIGNGPDRLFLRDDVSCRR